MRLEVEGASINMEKILLEKNSNIYLDFLQNFMKIN